MLFTCEAKPEEVYELHVQVQGLDGEQLELSYNSGSATASVSPGTSSVTLPWSYHKGDEYDVGIHKHPVDQFCTVINPSGTFGTSDVSNVIVFCQNITTLEVELQAPVGFASSKAKATLIKVGAGSYRAGQVAFDEVNSQGGGKMSFSIKGEAPTSNKADQDPGAPGSWSALFEVGASPLMLKLIFPPPCEFTSSKAT